MEVNFCLFCIRRQRSWVHTHKTSKTSFHLYDDAPRPETWGNCLRDINLYRVAQSVAELQFAPRPRRFHALFTSHHIVSSCGRQAVREGGKKERSPAEKTLPFISYSFALLLGHLRHRSDHFVYSLQLGTLWTLWGQRPHLCPLCHSHLVTQCFDLTWPIGPSSIVFSSSVGARWPSLNYMWLSFVSLKMEVGLPQPRVTWQSHCWICLYHKALKCQ